MSVILNSISRKSKDYSFFRDIEKCRKTLKDILDYVYYVFCHNINFENSQKLISILYYIYDEMRCEKKFRHVDILQKIINEYSEYIIKANYVEYLNHLVVLKELKVSFEPRQELVFIDIAKKADDPIMFATLLYYASNNEQLKMKYLNEIETIINNKINNILVPKDALLYREFWYIIVFYKCPYLSNNTKKAMEKFLRKIYNTLTSANNSYVLAMKLFLGFLMDTQENNGFISWNRNGARMLEEITYRTNQRTLFRNKHNYTDMGISI